MSIRLQDMALVVTGAAKGIGRAIACRAAAQGVRRILATDRDQAGLLSLAAELSGVARTKTIVADLAEAGACADVAAAARAAFGRIDGLVNAAGLTNRASFLDGTAQDFDKIFSVNARAPFLLMGEAIRDMQARGSGGGIVNIQSMNAHCGAPDLAIYAASKGALQTLTKNAANAHLHDVIRVNGINLGWALTESEHETQTGALGQAQDWAEQAGQGLPLGRLLMPDEAARLAVFLLSPESFPMTGVCVDLEQSVLGAPR